MKRAVVIPMVLAALMLFVAPSASQSPPTASFNFRDARAEDALRLIATQFGYSIVSGKTAAGSITASLTNVSFVQAVAYVAEASGCEYRIEEKVLVINPAEMVSRVFPLRYLDPDAARAAVARVLSERGRVDAFSGHGEKSTTQATAMSNALVVTDTSTRLVTVGRVLQQMDVKPRLVAIEAKLVETTLGADEKLGIDWQLRASATGAILPTTFPFPKREGSGDLTATPNPNNQVGGIGPAFPPGETFPYANPDDYTFGKLSFQEFSVALDILKQSSRTNLVSAPQVTTLDNQPAEIVVGTVVPIAKYERLKETGTLEVTGYDEKKVGVRLTVTPRVGPDSSMILSVNPEISEIVEYRGQFNERPVTATRSALTQVEVRTGETLMIGGLIREQDLHIERKVPILGDIPLLNFLFRHKATQKQKVDLMIFITPHLLN
jgi:type II secretory pathway component GspD/PulD (secretin)